MDSLSDWYRYLDQVSRPVRPDGEEAAAPAPESWRPWRPPPDEESPDAIDPDALPDLSSLIGRTRTEATPEPEPYRDPTVDDTLEPAPDFPTPSLAAPSFDFAPPPASGPMRAPQPEPSPAPEKKPPARSRAGEPGDSPDRQQLIQRLTDPTLTLEQTATILKVCPTTVRRYTNRGVLKHFRTQGNQRRFRLSDVLEFMESSAAELAADVRAEEDAARRDGGDDPQAP